MEKDEQITCMQKQTNEHTETTVLSVRFCLLGSPALVGVGGLEAVQSKSREAAFKVWIVRAGPSGEFSCLQFLKPKNVSLKMKVKALCEAFQQSLKKKKNTVKSRETVFYRARETNSYKHEYTHLVYR